MEAGRLPTDKPITLKDLEDNGIVTNIKHGVKLLARVRDLKRHTCFEPLAICAAASACGPLLFALLAAMRSTRVREWLRRCLSSACRCSRQPGMYRRDSGSQDVGPTPFALKGLQLEVSRASVAAREKVRGAATPTPP